ncbi:MAG: hypothetical protein RL065_1818 [Bacteroidota bacterium]
MQSNISKLQFITPQATHSKEFYKKIEFLLSCGINWLQYRNKLSAEAEFIEIGKQLQKICKKYNTTFIVNDRIHLAKILKADGVHVGQKDDSITEVKKILGDKFIIGNSTNNYNEIEAAQKAGASYVGLGPFQFTNTKDNLNPILGLNGYQKIMMNAIENISIPIVAIGGLTINEIIQIKKLGINHFAMSSYLFNMNTQKEIYYLIEKIHSTKDFV